MILVNNNGSRQKCHSSSDHAPAVTIIIIRENFPTEEPQNLVMYVRIFFNDRDFQNFLKEITRAGDAMDWDEQQC
jgi:hypothetical protein